MPSRPFVRARWRAAIAAALAVGSVAICAIGPSAGAQEAVRSLPTITPQGVGALRLGATVKALHGQYLIGRLRPGCELDPGQRIARLRPPLRGFATFSHPNNRVSSISIEGGAQTAKKVGVGSTPGEVLDAYPRALHRSPGAFPPFAEGFIWVNSMAHPKMMFTIDADTRLVSAISVPYVSFCE